MKIIGKPSKVHNFTCDGLENVPLGSQIEFRINFLTVVYFPVNIINKTYLVHANELPFKVVFSIF